jgi:2-keto-3-deoxy-galactonokinase
VPSSVVPMIGGAGSPIDARGPTSPPWTYHQTPAAVRTAIETATTIGRRGVLTLPGLDPYWRVAVPVMLGWTVQTNPYVPAGRGGTS